MTDNPTQNVVNALNQISLALASQTKVIDTVFPTTVSTSSSATSGAIAAHNYVGYLVVANPLTGGTVKIPYYAD